MKSGMQAQSIRLSNTSLVLRTVLASPTPISRTVIADKTGLTRATVSRLVDSLIAAHLIEELEPERTSPGRPGLPLRATSRQCVTLGLEISAEYLSLCLMDISGTILQQDIIEDDLRNSDPYKVMKRLSVLVDTIDTGEAFILAAILCIPGIFTDTTIRIAPNLGWRNIDLKPLFTPRLPLPELILLNEADGGGYAALYDAPGQQVADNTFTYISGSVGIGAAMFLNGTLLAGRHNWAGEFGHICIDPTGPHCSCTSNGCLETYAGFDAILSSAHLPLKTHVDDVILAFDDDVDGVRDAINQAAISLGRGIATIVNLLDLDVIIFGGTLATLLSRMTVLLNDELQYRVLGSRWSSISLRASTKGRLAPAMGACYQAFERLINEPETVID